MKFDKTGKMLFRNSTQGFLGKKVLSILVWIGLTFATGHVLAADIPLPPVNLGDTNFEDGIAFPGWLAEETISYYHAGQLNDHQGDKIPVPTSSHP